eukprot:jgi/Bigna1/128792/aug1.7_g3500
MLFVLAATLALSTASSQDPSIEVILANSLKERVFGRLVVYASVNNKSEPRTQCSDGQDTAQAFGIDVLEGKPGSKLRIDSNVLGYPQPSLREIVGRQLYFQAEIRPYEFFQRGDGVNVTLPRSCVNPGGNDGAYPAPVGSLYSSVVYGKVVASSDGSPSITLSVTEEVFPSANPGCSGNGADSKWIKTVNVESARLSKFWGRSMMLQACVLLPYGFEENPDATYPLVIAHGHFSSSWMAGGSFRESPPDPKAQGYAKVDQEYGHYLYRNWTGKDSSSLFHGARMLVITINHPVPFFDDSYAVNSENVGPYGDAVMFDLLPAVEKRFRGIGAGWARAVMGGSTGGWESLAAQVFYPKEFNGAYAACPDPVSFTSYTTVNIYEEGNAYYYDAPFKRTPRPGVRDSYSGQTVVPGTSEVDYGHPYGQTSATVEEMNLRELVLGPKSRSCGQWDIWEAVFSPRGADGYPERIWDKKTGKINKTTANFWRDNYDLLHIMKRDWKTKQLGSLLQSKIHVFVGASDTFFLTDAVMDLQDFLESTKEPYYNGSVLIGTHDGRGFEHCFNGYLPDGTVAPNGITRNLYLQKFLPEMAQRFIQSAPAGADLTWSQY